MTDRIPRPRNAAQQSNTPSPHAGTGRPTGTPPGVTALIAALGDDGVRRLGRQRRTHGAAGALADLVWSTACEADYLHAHLYRHAADLRDWLDALTAHPPAKGILPLLGHVSDQYAARLVQQMSQLTVVLKSYQATFDTPGS
ncbi:hypothetical protein ACFWZY_28660 [Streptomyces sp. NPDC058992]|uniref:hypothetical protein n=1 Tax=Streptomyces sp. NPDC058992 TaxID=3346688 RepID=UPI0036AA881E